MCISNSSQWGRSINPHEIINRPHTTAHVALMDLSKWIYFPWHYRAHLIYNAWKKLARRKPVSRCRGVVVVKVNGKRRRWHCGVINTSYKKYESPEIYGQYHRDGVRSSVPVFLFLSCVCFFSFFFHFAGSMCRLMGAGTGRGYRPPESKLMMQNSLMWTL